MKTEQLASMTGVQLVELADAQLAWAIRQTLDGGRVKVSRRIRQAMLERIEPFLRGRSSSEA